MAVCQLVFCVFVTSGDVLNADNDSIGNICFVLIVFDLDSLIARYFCR